MRFFVYFVSFTVYFPSVYCSEGGGAFALPTPIINFPECETMSQKHLPGGPRTNGNHADRLM